MNDLKLNSVLTTDIKNKKTIDVLLVEDNLADAKLFEYTVNRSVKEQNYSIHISTFLKEALQHTNENHVDVVLLDLNLPDSQGLDTLCNFLTVFPQIPVVILTGMDNDSLSKSALRAGAQDYIVKGEYNASIITRVIDYAIERKAISRILFEKDYKYRYIFDNSVDSIFITSKTGSRFLNFNSSLQKLLGYSRPDLFLINPVDLFVDVQEFVEAREEFLENGFVNRKEVRLRSADHEILYCLLNLNDVRDINQQNVGLQGIITDITSITQKKIELKKLNQVLEFKVLERTKELNTAISKVEEKNKQITESINYAKNIQHAFLPTPTEVSSLIPTSFVLFKPRDIVSGDFYWLHKTGNKIIVIVADCTGHGVPGAFMSFIGHQQLNEIVKERGQTIPSRILTDLNNRVKKLLRQDVINSEHLTDGMDVAVCCFDFYNNVLEFSGAMRPIYHLRNGDLAEIKGDRKSVGGSETEKRFTTKKISLRKDDLIYIFTDGYADQFGGRKEKKFMTNRLKKLLIEINEHDMPTQRQILEDRFLDWKKNHFQVDDICAMGVRIEESTTII